MSLVIGLEKDSMNLSVKSTGRGRSRTTFRRSGLLVC